MILLSFGMYILTAMDINDKIFFSLPSPHYHLGWPHKKIGTVVSHPYRNIWYVCVDNHPLSRVPVTRQMVDDGKISVLSMS
jgi:hypothetical protein